MGGPRLYKKHNLLPW